MALASTSKTPGGLSPASSDLGLGTMLTDQVTAETEEQRKKRMLAQSQQGGSLAVTSLFGANGGIGP